MDALTVHRGRGVPLRRSNVDTDQIVPSRFLKRITRHGFEDAAFATWREDPGFVLNDPAYAGATILVAGRDFGTGSSREIAVWALQDYGFRVVVASRFGDIFRTNCGKAGLLAVVLEQHQVEKIWAYIDGDPARELTVDLEGCTVIVGDDVFSFAIDADTRYRLLNGLDDIALTSRSEQAIAAFESRRPSYMPRVVVGE
ncbi:3-isopropylmalate dehydratase small subunit [Microbacterium sp.]|uniref:3-isopropylmalate dehydratase small subunit n=1 Tax=Microbacterium sp. TaxID=51671 RepID=UPI003A8C993E